MLTLYGLVLDIFCTVGAFFHAIESRRTVYHDLIAEQPNLGVALDIDGIVFTEFGFGGDEQWAVVYIYRERRCRGRRIGLGSRAYWGFF
jgi:hypothetical protein